VLEILSVVIIRGSRASKNGSRGFKMAEWIEVPAIRVLKVSRSELLEDFELIAETGHPSPENFQLARRRKDQRLFRAASLVPIAAWHLNHFFLEEV
jgi:hypothetical protein